MMFLESYKNAINTTWDNIAGDVLAMEQEMGNCFIEKPLIVEMVLDANRVEQYGDLDKDSLAGWKGLNLKDKINIAESCLPDQEWV